MELNCQNCSQIISDNFCGNCGQKKYKRIDKKYIWDEIQYTFLHTNKGFLYSVKNILKNPGKTAREFIDGNRVNHYKPILLAFVLSGISTFISFKVIGLNNIMKDYYSNQKLNIALINDYMSIASSYNSVIMLLLIPLIAIFTKLAFRKWGHNYYEHIVMNAFGLSFYTIVSSLILSPILYIGGDNRTLFLLISSFPFLLVPLIMVWFYKGFYKEKTLKSIIARVLLIAFVLFVCFVVLIFALIIFYVSINGPESLKYMQAK